ncbi:MAG TPA: cytochrome c biogenesis protein CcsA [Saprospiraceae bacterium]|nr:cytochrome c biogenesis protein CcsA [Saprospiraceae bacterium]
MQEVQYIGEHISLSHVGYILVLSAFFSSLYLIIAGIKLKSDYSSLQWRKAVTISYVLHVFFVLSTILLLFYIMDSKFYEFRYVWAHVNDELPRKYILSAFWEGQEGSFLLWMFWNCILGFFFIKRWNPLHNGVILIIGIAQFILSSMLLGFYIGDLKIGSNPFILLRHTMNIPLFQNAQYLSLIKGNGLNPLLQNYWMTIHPPTLFLGFSSTIIPYAMSFSALWHKEYEEWKKPTLSWALFSASVLGLGILMGGAWAYEALSFGGYWAWDPVENMSLVPWIILIAGIHSNLIALNTQYSTKSAFILYFLCFVLVVYSSFLTRSGVLGDSSVHAFTQMGLEWQLISFLLIFLVIPTVIVSKRNKQIRTADQEEQSKSKEFWMFIGVLILVFSAGLITFTTSIPVYNKCLDWFAEIFKTDWSNLHRNSPIDPISHHNKFQIWVAITIALLMSSTIFLRYLGTKNLSLPKNYLTTISAIALVSFIACLGQSYFFSKAHFTIHIFHFSAWFALLGSLTYLIKLYKSDLKSLNSAVAHAGFAILLFGISLSGLKKQNLVPDRFFQEDLTANFDNADEGKHFVLIQGEAKFLKGYWVNYKSDTLEGKFRKYKIQFDKIDSSNSTKETFIVEPTVQYDNKMTKVAASNPSTQHYFGKDIFTLIAQIPASQTDAESAKKAEDSIQYKLYTAKLNDTIFTSKAYCIIKDIKNEFTTQDFEFKQGDKKLQLICEIRNLEDTQAILATPSILFRNESIYRFPHQINQRGIRIQIPDSIFSILNPQPNWETATIMKLGIGETKEYDQNQISVSIEGIESKLSEEDYAMQESDIAIATKIKIKANQNEFHLRPLYVIRNSKAFSLTDFNLLNGYCARINSIDPTSEKFEIQIVKREQNFNQIEIPIEIADNAPRTDFIVMEAIVFPGINLVWLGSLMMIFSLLSAAYLRKTKKNVNN